MSDDTLLTRIEPGAGRRDGGLRVAVVDDDAASRQLLTAVLRSRGHEVRPFDDAADALLALGHAAAEYDLVVSDLRMPGLPGDALCRTLGERLGALAPPVVVVSGSDDEEEVGRALDSGARHFIRKPFAPGELLAVAARTARGASRRRGGEEGGPAPTSIGPYLLEGELGRGGMGVVYRARREGLEGPVALKVLRTRQANVEDLIRFRRELDLLAALRHPGLAHLVETGSADGAIYYAMELVEGQSLRRHVEEGPFPWPRAAQVGARLADTLAYVHAEGVVHRDVKPENVILAAPEGGPRLVDFGLARRPIDLALTRADWVLGTPLYLAPEAADGGEVTPAADVFALGLTVLECLAGRHPLQGEVRGPLGAALVYRAGGLPAARELAPAVPAELEALLRRATRPEPSARPSAAELAAGLAAIARAPSSPCPARADWTEAAAPSSDRV